MSSPVTHRGSILNVSYDDEGKRVETQTPHTWKCFGATCPCQKAVPGEPLVLVAPPLQPEAPPLQPDDD